ncbi:MAG: FAD-dependent oxidoreductase, partial [Parachlamydia sp.]|nr:FAD-dependent oxidoreductase [Parachlamydia sp.]
MERVELAVIGAGPGGYVAAAHAAALGMRTVCIDKNPSLGGTCLNVGCIPSKTLLHATELFEKMAHQGQEMGIRFDALQADFKQMMERKKSVVEGLCKGVEGLFK